MGLETTTYIDGLVVTNPTSLDPKSQGDDHLRLIKSALKSSFPNINAAVTATPAQINQLTTPDLFVPSGVIVMWSGLISNIPSGWLLCNGTGTISTGTPVPDLRNRFIVGAGDTYDEGDTGGSATHTHTITVNNHTLTVDQIPGHTHTTVINDKNDVGRVRPGYVIGGSSDLGSQTWTSSSVGGGQGHNHTATSGNGSSLPPYLALAYIIKN